MPQKKEPKKSDEEKAAEKVAKANASMLKAIKNDEVAKVEDANAKGADINFITEKGDQSMAHVAAAFGALDVIRYLHKNGADFTRINAVRAPSPLVLRVPLWWCGGGFLVGMPPRETCQNILELAEHASCLSRSLALSRSLVQAKKTPLESAVQIGEENAAKLIEALLAGKSGDDIGKSSADDELLDIGDGSGDDEAPPTDRSTKKGAASKGEGSSKKPEAAAATAAAAKPDAAAAASASSTAEGAATPVAASA